MGRISDAAIRDIRERSNLAEVVGDVVSLRRRGNSTVGLCPFHTEKTPSFTVSEERGFFHCFGCGEHGDVFTFVMKTEGLLFPDAVRRVAGRFGIAVPEDLDGGRSRGEPLIAACAAAARFFRDQLRGPAGEIARAYLRERGLRDETIDRFNLGYAPGAGEALARHLRTQGLSLDDAATAGLVLRRTNGPGVFDRFRERIMFPIADASGRVIAFGGRTLPNARPVNGEKPAKYLNSPETPIFHKGATVYGLAMARNAIRTKGRAIVVEGYLDVISLAEAGIEEAVAPLGTALTADQLKVLRRQTDVVIACFDGDAAGQRAAARSFPVFLEAGLWGRGVFLPAGEDPDTFVRTQGAPALERLVEHATPLLQAYVDSIAGSKADAVGRQAEAAKEVARLLKQLRQAQDSYGFDALVRVAAQQLGVPEDKFRQDASGEPAAGTVPRMALQPTGIAASGAEEMLVELMAAYPSAVDAVRDARVLDEFADAGCRDFARAFLEASEETRRAELMQALPRALRDRVAHRLLNGDADDDRHQAVSDCIARIRQRRPRQQTASLREQLRAAEARGDVEAARTVMQRLRDLTEKSLR